MRLVWTFESWEDYIFWQSTDRTKVKKINSRIKDALNTHFSGIGKPEALKFDLSGHWSRRIDMEHRMVYSVEDGCLVIVSCRYHYQ